MLKIDDYEHKTESIGALQDELKARDRRIEELHQQLDDERDLVRRLMEQAEDDDALFEQWKHAFGMELNDAGEWAFGRSVDQEEWLLDLIIVEQQHNALVRKFNALAAVVDARRHDGTLAKHERGRQLKATPEQRAIVFESHCEGRSLRECAEDAGVSLQTVRHQTVTSDIKRNLTLPENELRSRNQTAKRT